MHLTKEQKPSVVDEICPHLHSTCSKLKENNPDIDKNE